MNNKKIALVFLVVVFCMISIGVQANGKKFNNGYFGIGMGKLSDGEFSAGTGVFITGFELGENVSLESHLGISDNDTANYPEYGADVKASTKFNYYASIRARFSARLMNMLPYFYLGYTSAELETTISGLPSAFAGSTLSNAKQTLSGFSYGVGIDLFGNSSTSLFLSYGRLLQKKATNETAEFKTNGLFVGFSYFLGNQRSSHPR